MANKTNYTYEEIDNPYNELLERSSSSNEVLSSSESTGTESSGGVMSSGPGQGTQEITSESDIGDGVVKEGAFGDVYISSFIKSRNYLPKKRGFLIEGKEGYIECMKLFVGSGGIIGGKLDVPDETSNDSFHVDVSGNTWWGSNVSDGYASAPAYILNTGYAKFSSGQIGGITIGTDYLQSTNYVGGLLGKGFKLDANGDAEFQNIKARGKISTSVFQKDTISAVGGNLIVSSSDIVNVDMTALDASSLVTENVAFPIGTILRIKDGTDDEWLEVTGVTSFTHTVTRDLEGNYSADSNPIWKKGTAVVSMAEVDKGFIEMNTSDTNSPYMKIYQRDSLTYNDIDTKVILGNLKDKTGVEEYGLWIKSGAAYIAGYRLFEAVVDPNGDGDYLTVQAALTAGKRRIFVRSGTYVVSSAMVISLDNTFIVGENKYSTIFQIDSGTSNMSIFEVGVTGSTETINVNFSNIKLDGNAFTGSSNKGIKLINCTDVIISNCLADDIDGHSIYGGSVSGDIIKNININNCSLYGKWAIEFYNEAGSTMEEIFIKNNFIEGWTGVAITGVSKNDVNIDNNFFNVNDTAVHIDFCENARITSNQIICTGASPSTDHAIYVSNVFGVSGYCAVVNNYITNAPFNAIYLGVNYTQVTNNVIENSSQSTNNDNDDISIYGLYNNISGNIIIAAGANKSRYAIYEYNGSDYNLIHGNISKGQVTGAIYVIGANTITNDNIYTVSSASNSVSSSVSPSSSLSPSTSISSSISSSASSSVSI